MSNKEFNRNVCFTFFEDYRKTAKELEEDFGKEMVADYYNAIIDYALYGIEPELKGAIKYVWHTTKTSIDKSIERRSGGFRENTEQTEKVLKYKEENPEATQREIAEATGISLGKVNKALKANSSSNTNSNTNSSSNTIREREHEHASRAEEKTEKKERDLEDLTDEELNSLLRRYRAKEKYSVLQNDFSLSYGILSKELPSQINSILKERHKEELDKQKEEEIDRILATCAAFSDVNYDDYINRRKRKKKEKN